MDSIGARIDEVAASTNFSGVVRVDSRGVTIVERAYGLADRRHGIANTTQTRFALATRPADLARS